LRFIVWSFPKGPDSSSTRIKRRGQRQEKLVKIGARIVSHARYVTFQMAEVAMPSQLFAEILRLIDGLRPPPTAA
jgi:hypothetical protein